jgi:hypothetical protein
MRLLLEQLCTINTRGDQGLLLCIEAFKSTG